jgi:hypothetical protein
MTFKDRMIHAALNAMFERRDIEIDGALYLRRWYLKGRGSSEQWFLHNIRLPDAGRDLHDHPWDFTTKILAGGYTEQVEDYGEDGVSACSCLFTHRPCDEARHMAEHTHRIASVLPGTYTLVKTGPARRTWGFWVSERLTKWTCGTRWKSWRDYFGKPHSEPDWPEDQIKG